MEVLQQQQLQELQLLQQLQQENLLLQLRESWAQLP